MNIRFKQLSLLPAIALCMMSAALVAEPADARVYVGGSVSVHFDSGGFPVWGYGGGRPIYAYDPYGVPIYAVNAIYPGCFVPTWGPAPYYQGSYCWPRGVYYGHFHGHPHFRGNPYYGSHYGGYRGHYGSSHFRGHGGHGGHGGRGGHRH